LQELISQVGPSSKHTTISTWRLWGGYAGYATGSTNTKFTLGTHEQISWLQHSHKTDGTHTG
jgi:hypothetical protein